MVEVHNHATYSRFGSPEHPVTDETAFSKFINDVVQAAQSPALPNSVISQLEVLLTSVKGKVFQE